jgi:hypothetical protein
MKSLLISTLLITLALTDVVQVQNDYLVLLEATETETTGRVYTWSHQTDTKSVPTIDYLRDNTTGKPLSFVVPGGNPSIK